MSDKKRKGMVMRILMDIGLVTIGAIMGVSLMCILQVGARFERDYIKILNSILI